MSPVNSPVMRFATTAILAATSLGLGVAIHRVDHRPVSGKRAAALAQVLIRYEPASVEKITVERGVAKTVLEKRQGDWFFSEPETDRVDPSLALALIDRLNHLGIVEDLEREGASPDPIPLGIAGDRAIRVTLEGPARDKIPALKESLVLGIEAPRSGSIYARREGDDAGVFVVDGNPRPWLENPLEAMRDRRLLGVPVGAVVQLVVRQASGEVSLQRRITPPAQDWALAAPLVAWADREAMDRLLTSIASLRLEEVVEDADLSEAIPNPLPENAAVLQFGIHGFSHPITAYLREVGKAEDGRPLLEVRISDRPVVYRLASDFLASLPDSPNALRDRTLARLPLEAIQSIKIQSPLDPLVDLRSERSGQGITWRVALHNKLVPANTNEVNSLVASVNEAAIQRFVSDDATDLSEYGLARPQRRIFFQLAFPGEIGPDGVPGPPRELTRILLLGWKEGERQRLYASFEGEAQVYELDPTFLNLVPTHPVKWKSLNVLTFNPMHLVSITRETPEKESLALRYDYRRDQWEATRNGLDVTPSLDVASVRRLRDRLGSLTASGWYLTLAPAYEALQNPRVTFRIVTTELDRASNERVEQVRLLKIAPSAGDLYFGQIVEGGIDASEASNDVFFLDHETYRGLMMQVTTARLPNP